MKVYFEFSGGPRDGEVVEGDTSTADPANRNIDDGTALYWETRYGQSGEEFIVWAPRLMKKYFHRLAAHAPNRTRPAYHLYQVRDRYAEGEEVWITADYRGAFADLPPAHDAWFWESLVAKGITEALPAMNPPTLLG